jgi:hypothetical protein
MPRTSAILALLCSAVLLTACRPAETPALATLVATAAAPTETRPPDPNPTSTPTVRPAATETSLPPTPVPTDTPVPTSEPESTDLSINHEQVMLYPIPALYAGDLVSVRVEPYVPPGIAPNDVAVTVYVNGVETVTGVLNWRNLNNDMNGMYPWVWDTTGEEGEHVITVLLDPYDRIQEGDEDPGNNRVDLPVTVFPRSSLPPRQANARWMSRPIACCDVHVVSGTAAARDLDRLLPQVDDAFQSAADVLDMTINKRYQVYLIDRVIGQGGYAGADMVVSYLDRDYSGGGLREVLVHEAVHLLDRDLTSDRIPFLSEGVAVWAAGGHYYEEDLTERAWALSELGRLIPLETLINDFYPEQHEIGYLQAASLIGYLAETFGWPQVRDYYAAVSYDDGHSLTEAVSVSMERHFGRSLAEIEADWLAYLGQQPRNLEAITALEAGLRFYETMRSYQAAYDPTAYYLYAWLPTPSEAQKRGATADLSRRPATTTNIALETMLQASAEAMLSGNFERFEALISAIQRVMDNHGRFLDPLSRAYLAIVETSAEAGYEVQQIALEGERAAVMVLDQRSGRVSHLNMRLTGSQTWTFTQ